MDRKQALELAIFVIALVPFLRCLMPSATRSRGPRRSGALGYGSGGDGGVGFGDGGCHGGDGGSCGDGGGGDGGGGGD
ncbi:hypothetical protein ACLBXO_07040 [Methylobacterium sp. C33D]